MSFFSKVDGKFAKFIGFGSKKEKDYHVYGKYEKFLDHLFRTIHILLQKRNQKIRRFQYHKIPIMNEVSF